MLIKDYFTVILVFFIAFMLPYFGKTSYIIELFYFYALYHALFLSTQIIRNVFYAKKDITQINNEF